MPLDAEKPGMTHRTDFCNSITKFKLSNAAFSNCLLCLMPWKILSKLLYKEHISLSTYPFNYSKNLFYYMSQQMVAIKFR